MTYLENQQCLYLIQCQTNCSLECFPLSSRGISTPAEVDSGARISVYLRRDLKDGKSDTLSVISSHNKEKSSRTLCWLFLFLFFNSLDRSDALLPVCGGGFRCLFFGETFFCVTFRQCQQSSQCQCRCRYRRYSADCAVCCLFSSGLVKKAIIRFHVFIQLLWQQNEIFVICDDYSYYDLNLTSKYCFLVYLCNIPAIVDVKQSLDEPLDYNVRYIA